MAKMLARDEHLHRYLLQLHKAGYPVMVVGHSLGAGVASILSVLLRRHKDPNKCVPARVYAFAPPACMSEALSIACRPHVRSCVLRDDVVVRTAA